MSDRNAPLLTTLSVFLLFISFSSSIRLQAQESSLGYGQTVSGTISTRNPLETWTFEGDEGEAVEITMTSDDGLDSYLQLVDPSDFVIAENDDEGATVNSKIEITLPSDGTYTVIATRYGGMGGTATGSYSLRVSLINADSGTGSAIPSTEINTGPLSRTWETDYLRFGTTSLVADMIPYIVLPSNNAAVLTAPTGGISLIDLLTGQLRWQTGTVAPILTADADLIVTLQAAKRIDAVETSTGQTRWRLLLEDALATFDIVANIKAQTDENYVYIPVSRHITGGIEDATLSIEKASGAVAAVLPGTVRWASTEGVLTTRGHDELFFLSPTGTVKQQTRIFSGFSPTTIIAESTVIALESSQGTQGPVFSLVSRYISDGSVAWRYPDHVGRWWVYTPGNNNVYVWQTDDSPGHVLAIDKTTGNLLWTSQEEPIYSGLNPSPWETSPIWEFWGEYGDLVLFSQRDFQLTRAYDRVTGELIWETGDYALPGRPDNLTIIGVIDGTLVILAPRSQQGYVSLRGIDVFSGQVRWERPVDAHSYDFNLHPIFILGRLLYSGRNDDGIYVLDLTTGEELQTFMSLEGEPKTVYPSGIEGQILLEVEPSSGAAGEMRLVAIQ